VVLRAYGVSDQGKIRPTNEDRFAIHEELGLCVIADGMGGHNAGEVAAHLAVEAVVEFVRERAGLPLDQAGERDSGLWPFGFDPALTADGNLLRTAIHLANVQILETALSAGQYAGMGTTIVAARVADGRLSVAHVGDSRLYMFAGRRLRQVTRDDSWIATVLAHDPQADPLLLQLHPMRNALTNVVGARPRTDVHVVEEQLAGGELLLLTTDGVHGVLDDPRIEQLMGDDEDPGEIARHVIATALVRGSRDNCTAIVARYYPTNL
jgi:serine/threonine protein phosphatase PrpC